MEQGGVHSDGFTIVETLIFLTISAVLAASALLLISGRQNKTEFQTAINDLQQKVQQVINETASGYYPNTSNFDCSAPGGTAPTFTYPGSASQGTNNDCIFVGKALRFGDAITSPTFKADEFTVYSLAANRLDSLGNEVTCYTLAAPIGTCPASKGASITAIAENSHHKSTDLIPYPPDTTTTILQNGLSFSWIKYNGGAQDLSHFALFGFLTTLASYNSSSLLNSGSQQLLLYGFTPAAASPPAPPSVGAVLGGGTQNTYQVADAIDGNVLQSYQTVAMCFNSATTHQSALLTIGDASNGGLGVSLKIYATTVDCT